MDIRSINFEAPDASDLPALLKSSSLVFGNLDIKTTKAYLVSIALPASWQGKRISEFEDEVFQSIRKATKTTFTFHSSFYSKKLKHAVVRILASGISKSKGIEKMLKGAVKDTTKYKSKEGITSFDLSNLEFDE
jgi:hypothetical protein